MYANNITVISVVFLYITCLMYLGYRGFKKTHAFSDYILGGRKLGPIIGAMNVGASDMSSWILMGLPAAFMLYGINQIWIVIGLIIGSYASWRFVAARLRKYSEIANDSLTVSSFLENRFHDNTKILRIVTSIIILFFFIIYIASGFVGSAKLFAEFFDMKYSSALILSCIIIASYALMGGFFAISWADLFQGILILFTLLIMPCVLLYHIIYDLEINPVHFILSVDKNRLNPFYDTTLTSFMAILAWGLGYFGQPHIISKYMAINDAKDFRFARIICISWMSATMFATAIIGILGFVYFYDAPLKEPENIFIASGSLFLHPVLVGILISAVLSAIMSTINSQIIICCSVLSEDLYKRFIHKKAKDKEMLVITRICVIIVALTSVIIALDETNSVLSLVAQAWAGLGSSIGPIVLFSLFWKKTTKTGAIAGVLSGSIGAIIFRYLDAIEYEMLPAFALSCICIYIFSKFTKVENPKQVESEFSSISKN